MNMMEPGKLLGLGDYLEEGEKPEDLAKIKEDLNKLEIKIISLKEQGKQWTVEYKMAVGTKEAKLRKMERIEKKIGEKN